MSKHGLLNPPCPLTSTLISSSIQTRCKWWIGEDGAPLATPQLLRDELLVNGKDVRERERERVIGGW